MQEFLLLICAYLFGSIPTAVWVSKFHFGIDIRDYGSGNAGATNMFRILGKKAGVFVMLVDILKGVAAVKLCYFLPQYVPYSVAQINFQLILGLTALLGHVFPIFAQFKGGKGVATLFGMILAIQPLVAACCIGVFFCMLLATKYVSLSSITASILFPVLVLIIFKEPELSYRLFALSTALLVVLTHQKNIGRLLHGNESKINLFKKQKPVT